jgi:CBS domain-containing protein
MSPTISSLMQRQVWSVGLDDSVQAVEAQMAAHGLSWLPVLEGNATVVGVISAADLLRFHADGKDPSQVRAWQLCSYKPIVVGPQTSAREVAQLMVERGIHHVVVSDASGLRGVVSSLDFVRTFATSQMTFDPQE